MRCLCEVLLQDLSTANLLKKAQVFSLIHSICSIKSKGKLTSQIISCQNFFFQKLSENQIPSVVDQMFLLEIFVSAKGFFIDLNQRLFIKNKLLQMMPQIEATVELLGSPRTMAETSV